MHYEKFTNGAVKCIEDEIPFELPYGWAWCRLRDIFNVCSAKRVLQSEWKTEGVPFYRAREIVKLANNGYVDNELFISHEHYENLKETYGVPQTGDLMVTGVGTIGKVHIVREDDVFYYKDASVLCFENRYGVIKSEYARIMIDSSLLQEQIHSQTYGNTVDTITISTANNYLCILPPISEQSKIVQSVKTAVSLIDKIEGDNKEIRKTISLIKSKVLDLAIRGKLVPQDPNDEPASILLERIRAEKEELIKQGKIKRDKKESIIFKGEDNSYYENLPEGWAITKLGLISSVITKGTTPRGGNVTYLDNGIGFLRAENIEGYDKLNLQNLKFIDENTHSGFLKRSILQKDDILITIAGTLGRTAIVTKDVLPLNTNQAVAIIRLVNPLLVNNRFVAYAINSNSIKKALLQQEVAMAIPNLSLENIHESVLPLPPLNEQLAIVEVIDKLFMVINDIEKSLN